MRPGIVDAVCICFLALAGWQAGSADVAKPAAPASVQIKPEAINFGTQSVGVSSEGQAVTMTNVSTSAVTIRDITVSGIDFKESDNCPSQLGPGAQCAIQVTFTPAITGPRIGSVIITDSDPNALFLVLTGTGK